MGSYTYAGVSRLDGEFKVRFANDALRTKVLVKNGHTDIDIVQLKHAMSKAEAVDYLLKIDFDNGNKEVRAALEAAQEKRAEKPAKVAKPKAEKAEKPAAKKTAKPAAKKAPVKGKAKVVPSKVAEVAPAATEDEDAPF